MYYDMVQVANDLISKYNDDTAAGFLQNKLEDPNSRKLALLSLAKLTVSNKAAENAMYDAIYVKKADVQKDAVTAIAYMDFRNARSFCETLLRKAGTWKVRKPAVEILVALGDQDTLKLFEEMQLYENNSFVRKAIESAIPQLQYRLTQVPPDKQIEWVENEVLCWRTLREIPVPLSGVGVNYRAAETLQMQGKHFARDYLEYKLNCRDLLGIAIIGNQKEAWAVPILGKHAVLGDSLGDFSRSALAKIRTSEALRALENAILPGGNSRANTQLLISLQQYGDDYTIEFMENLSKDERFSERERDALIYAYKIIESRLSGNGSPRSRGR